MLVLWQLPCMVEVEEEMSQHQKGLTNISPG
jgi:hypothetical protein